ncbi:hypothetical protein [Bernardetia sp.]|uniref:hypothetical protein n=1 Tax=Bernardetia sp. TaxID=1937974 RepID=UPI0025C287D9|nr:hypothetical protein [Bernardetia sp.]
MIKTVGGIAAGLFSTALLGYGISIFSLVKNIEFAFLGIQRQSSNSVLGSVIAPRFLIATQITNPSRVTVFLKAIFLTVYVETEQDKFIEIGTINQPNLNLEITGKNNTLLGIQFATDLVKMVNLVARGGGAIYRALLSGRIPKLRFTGNILVNKLRKRIDIIHEFE